MTNLVPCTVTPVWHEEGEDPTRWICEARDGGLETIPARVRDAVELAGRGGDDQRQVAVWLVEGSVGGEGA